MSKKENKNYNILGMPTVAEWKENYKNLHGHYPITVDEKLFEKLQKEEKQNTPNLSPGKPAKFRVTASSKTYKKIKRKH